MRSGRRADPAEIEPQRSVSGSASAPARRGRRRCCGASRRRGGAGARRRPTPRAAPPAPSTGLPDRPGGPAKRQGLEPSHGLDPPRVGEMRALIVSFRAARGSSRGTGDTHEEDRPRRRHRHDRRAADRPVRRLRQAPRHRRGDVPQAHPDDDRARQGQSPAAARREAGRRPRQEGGLRGARARGRLRGEGGAGARHRRHRLHAGRQREQEGLREARRDRADFSPRAASSASESPTRWAINDEALVAGQGPVPPDRLLQHPQHRRARQDALGGRAGGRRPRAGPLRLHAPRERRVAGLGLRAGARRPESTTTRSTARTTPATPRACSRRSAGSRASSLRR